MKGLGRLAILTLVLATACGVVVGLEINAHVDQSPPTGTLTVFAAASLTEAFTEIAEDFETLKPGSKVVINFAGSTQLAQQIGQGAPGDVFASGDKVQMETVIQSGRVHRGSETAFLHNQLVVVIPGDNPADFKDFRDLATPGLRLILGDSAVPVGRYSLAMLNKAAEEADYGIGFKESVLNNVHSFEENVRAVLSKVILGEADAGIVYVSDVFGAEVSSIPIPEEVNVTASYFIAPLSNSSNPKLALEFIDFVLSPQGQGILERYGFNGEGQNG